MNKINELRPFQKRVELTAKVISKNEVREVTSKLDNTSHKVTEALVADDSGAILLTLWDDLIEKIELEKTYTIANGYTSLFKNSLRMNIGRYGEIKESETALSEVNTENNLSEKEFQSSPRRFENRGRGGYGRGSYGGGRGSYNRGGRGGFERKRYEPKEESEEYSDEESSGENESYSEEE